MRPDGDVDLDATGDFVVADCLDCGGVLKPDVVFFGENVPGRSGGPVLRGGRRARAGRRAAGRRLVTDRDERTAVREARRQGRHARRHRQPRRDPRRRPGGVQARDRHNASS